MAELLRTGRSIAFDRVVGGVKRELRWIDQVGNSNSGHKERYVAIEHDHVASTRGNRWFDVHSGQRAVPDWLTSRLTFFHAAPRIAPLITNTVSCLFPPFSFPPSPLSSLSSSFSLPLTSPLFSSLFGCLPASPVHSTSFNREPSAHPYLHHSSPLLWPFEQFGRTCPLSFGFNDTNRCSKIESLGWLDNTGVFRDRHLLRWEINVETFPAIFGI